MTTSAIDNDVYTQDVIWMNTIDNVTRPTIMDDLDEHFELVFLVFNSLLLAQRQEGQLTAEAVQNTLTKRYPSVADRADVLHAALKEVGFN
jgi:hypothetical protein